MHIKSAVAAIALMFGFLNFAAAQAPTGTLVGRVSDTARAVVTGASVRVRDLSTNEIRTAKTNAQGEYTVSDLDPSTYEVTISMASFKEVDESSIELQAGQTARFDVVLQVGSVEEKVEVTTEVGVLNTETSDKGDVISPVEISEMPLDGRDFNDLVFNVAGVSPAEEGTKGSAFVANGARSDATNVIVDGLNNTNPRDSGAEATPPLDSLQEFKVQTSNFQAEYGRVAGPVINLSIKKGGNSLKGSIFEYFRNDLFDAGNYFDAPGTHSELRRNQFGGTLGGPVYIPHLYNGHNKTFFFFAIESYRQVAGSNTLGIVPSTLERAGNFTQSIDSFSGQPLAPNSLTDPITGKPLPGNILPQNLWNATAVTLMNFYPLPNHAGVNNYLVNKRGYTYWDNFIIKVDQQLASHDEASVKYLQRHQQTMDPFAGSDLGLWGSILHNQQTIGGITETHIFSPNLINEFRTGLTRNVNNQHSLDSGTNWAALLGIPGTTNNPSLAQFPLFKPTGYEVLGDSTQQPITFTTNNYDTNDSLTWSKGRHTAKFGASMLRTQYFQPTNSGFSGTLTFDGRNSGLTSNSGNAFAEFLRGAPSSTGLQLGNVTNHLFDNNYAVFAQDDYKILAGLTLNLGLRYEFQTLPHEENGQLSSFDPVLRQVVLASTKTVPNLPDLLAQAGLTGAVVQASDVGLPQTLVHPNHSRVAPRVGFAWRPFSNNQTVVRGSYGIFYTGSRLSVIRTEMAGQFPFSLSVGGSGTDIGPVTINNAFNNTALKGTNSVNGYDVNAPSSYLQSWNLTLERELPKGVAIEAAYTGSKGTHLGRQIDINQEIRTATNGGNCHGSKCTYPRPYDTALDGSPLSFTTIDFFSFNAVSSYNAGTVTLRKRFEHGLLFRANYTFAKALDTASALNYAGNGGYNGAQDSQHPEAEYGRADSDRRHVFNGNFVYMLPFNRNIIVRGWETAGSWQVESGTPFTPQLTGPTQDSGVPTRPDRICNGALPNPTVDRWFDTGCFPQVPLTAFRFGNSKRNILDGPKLMTVNLLLSRNFRVTEKSKLQFRWEVFNVLNHPNFMLPDDNVDEAGVGTITSARDPRVMQLGAKYTF
jgi:Carboxypeptidase regulatory-like domain/TonB dependent receptor/TonB-dependent Receptor Plug Domain